MKTADSAEPAAACRHGCASWAIVAAGGSSFPTSSHCAGTGCRVSGRAGMGEENMGEEITTEALAGLDRAATGGIPGSPNLEFPSTLVSLVSSFKTSAANQ